METSEARRVLFSRPPRAADLGWLLDLWFAEPEQHISTGWFSWTSEAPLRARIAAEIEGGDPYRLQRAIWLVYGCDLIANRVEILGHLAAGSDEAAAELARKALGWIEERRRARSPQPDPPPAPRAPRPLRFRPPRLRRPPR